MVLYLNDIPTDPVVKDILAFVIVMFILLLPYVVYYAPNNEYCFYIAFYMAMFITVVQIIAIFYNIRRYPL